MRPLKIGYLIGALSAGGSERQLSELAVGMHERGHDVQVFCYDGPGSFDAYIEEPGVMVLRGEAGSKFRKLWNAKRWLREFHPDIIHGFMKRASSLAILANLPSRACRVVGSDFSTATYDPHQRALRIALQLFRFADRVATQTEVNGRSLTTLAPWLHDKVVVVRNGVDTVRFQPQERTPEKLFRFLCVGTVWGAKNPVNVVRAVGILRDMSDRLFRVDWVGRYRGGPRGQETPEYREAQAVVRGLNLSKVFSFVGESERMQDEYHASDVLLHASAQDGIPNAVVEAMACGLPVVVSRVSDLPLIVEAGDNGFLCDASSPVSIAEAMGRMLALDNERRRAMGRRSRGLAESWFGLKRFVDDYQALYFQLIASAR